MTKDETPLSPRLSALADMVRGGARLIDVGTDHAYLPVYLAKSGKIEAALATDIASGPIARAKAHVSEAGVESAVRTMKTPGLDKTADFAPTDIVIAGMGGELIASIIKDAGYVKTGGIRLILQPMTKQDVLRLWLAQNGYETENEVLVEEDGRIYQALCAQFTGRTADLSPLEALVGKANLERGGNTLEKLLALKRKQLSEAAAGIRKGGKDALKEEKLISEIDAYAARAAGREKL